MKLGFMTQPQFQNSFQKLMKQEKLPLKTSFKLKGIHKIVTEELTKYEEVRNDWVKKCSLKDEAGNPKIVEQDGQTNICLKQDMLEEFNAKLIELHNLEINIPTLKSNELGEEKDLTLIPEDIVLLQFIEE